MAEDGNVKLNFDNTNFKINKTNALENVKINKGGVILSSN